jgi:hypothetical protein
MTVRISTLNGLTVGDTVKWPVAGEVARVASIAGDYEVYLRINGKYSETVFSGLALDTDDPKNFGFFVRCAVCGGRDPDYCDSHEFQPVTKENTHGLDR